MENGYTYQLRRAKKGLKGGKDRDRGGRTGKQEGGRMKEGREKEREKDDLLTLLQIHAEKCDG